MKNKKADKIVFPDAGTLSFGDISWGGFERLGNFRAWKMTSPAQLAARVRGTRIIITNKCRFDRRLLESLPDLKCLCVAATGTNNVDLKAAAERGIQVRNVAGYSTETVVQYTFAFLLALAGRLRELDHAARSGEWSRSPYFTVPHPGIIEVFGKTLGIVGYGTIGRRVAQVAKALGMKVLIARIPGKSYGKKDAVKRLPLAALARQSDFLTLHCPLSPLTRGLINQSILGKMKPGAFLINMARGEVVEERALRKALDSGHLGGAAADVLSQEPPPRNHFLLKSNRLLLTPHVAWASREARRRLAEEIRLNIVSFQKGINRNRVI